jgi:hypothetical protein
MAACALAACSPAHAQDVEAWIAAAPDRVVVPQREQAVFQLGLRAGPRPVRVAVNVRPLGRFGAPFSVREAYPIMLDPPPEVAGDAVWEGGNGGFGTVACSPTVPSHGEEGRGATEQLWLPAHGTATVTALFWVSPTPPWPGTDYRAVFTISGYEPQPASAALRPDESAITPRTVVPDPIAVSGLSGVQIRFRTLPETHEGGGNPNRPSFGAGSALAIEGLTNPPVSQLVITDLQGRERHEVATVPVDAEGRFSLRNWRPAGSGYHEVGMLYRSDRSDLADDYACVHDFDITDDAAVVPAQEPPRVAVDPLARRGRRGRVVATLRCPAEHWRRCEGTAALGRRTRGYSIRAGEHQAVRLRGRRRARRAVLAITPADGGSPVRATVRVRARS